MVVRIKGKETFEACQGVHAQEKSKSKPAQKNGAAVRPISGTPTKGEKMKETREERG